MNVVQRFGAYGAELVCCQVGSSNAALKRFLEATRERSSHAAWRMERLRWLMIPSQAAAIHVG